MAATNITPEQLANEFGRVLHEWLGVETIQRINVMNATGDNRVCATHEFCDANQAMIDAMAVLGIDGYDGSDEVNSLVNAAWSLAKANGFKVAECDQPS